MLIKEATEAVAFQLTDLPVDDGVRSPDEPPVPGLAFRRFRGKEDYGPMLAVIKGSKEADGIERTDTMEDITRNYRHLTNCDPYQDMIFAEVASRVVGYSRAWWWSGKDEKRLYSYFAFLLPAWRDKGIRRAMLRFAERRLRLIAADHEAPGGKFYDVWASGTETHWKALLRSEGFEVVRYGFDMVRPDLEDIPDLPLPDGLEVRPVGQEHYRAVREAAREAFEDEWETMEEEWSEDEFDKWQQEPNFQPDLWQVAWDGDQVVGMILNYIDREENEEYNRQRGYTESICVRRPWRRRGLARALIARSLRMHCALGMTEAALGVDADNPSGALHLYRSMGFREVRRGISFRKPLD